MKKLLLLFIGITALSCSSDDPAEVNDPLTELSISHDSRYCPDANTCEEKYRIINGSNKWINFNVRFTFNRVDSHYESTEYIMDEFAEGEINHIVSLPIDAETEVLSYEIINAEILQ